MNADVVLRGGTVVDGIGSAPRRADVVITAGIITVIAPPGSLTDTAAGTVLDVTGRAVSPGSSTRIRTAISPCFYLSSGGTSPWRRFVRA